MVGTDIALLELVLPRLSGLEVLVRLQAAPTRLPVIVVSAYAPARHASTGWIVSSGSA